MVLPLACCPAGTTTHRCAPIKPRSGGNAFKSPLKRISQQFHSCCTALYHRQHGTVLTVAQRAAALSEIHVCKSQSAWSPQRNLIKENAQPCWFCSVARSFLFALHKSQASRFGPVFPNLFWTRKCWNRDLRRHWGSMPRWRICFALQLLRLLLGS